MKNIFLLVVMTAFLAVSCSKDKEILKQDLADSVVGIYEGELTVTDAGKSNVQIRVTKLSSMEVQIEPFSGNESTSFGAKLVKDGDNVILNIPEQTLRDGGTVRGNANIIEGFPGAHGAYEPSTKAFGYAIKINVSGNEFDEIFIGVKK